MFRIALLASLLMLPLSLAGVVAAAPEDDAEALAEASQRFIARQDSNGDDKLSRDELPERMRRFFGRLDRDGDGFVSKEEDLAFRRARAKQRERRAKGKAGGGPAPTHANLKYGAHERNVVDLWVAKSKKPPPLVIYFHGGGFRAGDKRSLSAGLRDRLLEHGISVAAANYRLTKTAPFPAPMHDAGRAVQFLRHNAKTYNLDPKRVGAIGGSAGAGISLWLAFHDDLADPKSEDPVARQSTRLCAAVMNNGQSTYDPRTIAKLFDTDQVHPALIPFFGMSSVKDIENPKFHPLFVEASGLPHLTKDDVPILANYSQRDDPLPKNSGGGLHIHHPRFGHVLKKAMEAQGLECVLKRREDYAGKGAKGDPTADQVAFFARHLSLSKKPVTGSAPGGGDGSADR